MDQVLAAPRGPRTARASSTAATTSRKPGAEFHALNFNNKLCYHRVGTPQSADTLVYFRPGASRVGVTAARVTDDGRYLVIADHRREGTDRNRG